MAAKKCSKCGAEKSPAEFYRRMDAKDGLSHWCKPCMDAKRKANAALNPERERETRRSWSARNPEIVKASAAKSRARPEAKSRMHAYSAEWYERNRGRLKDVRRAWYLKNKPEHNARSRAVYYSDQAKWRAYNKAWAQSHKESMRAYVAVSDAKRRAAKLNSVGQFTADDVRNIYVMQRGCCAACRISLGNKFHRDHIVPLSRGGSNDKSNIQLLCQPCNQKKWAKDPLQFMREIGLLL